MVQVVQPIATISIENGSLLDRGRDSAVYLVGDDVTKIYHTASIEAVSRYHKAMNDAADSLSQKLLTYTLAHPADGEIFVEFRAAPTKLVGQTPEGRTGAVVEFIAGPTVIDLLNRGVQAEAACASLKVDDLWWANSWRERLGEVFQGPQNASMHLWLQDQLEERLGLHGVSIGEWNMKVGSLVTERVVTLVITDLALSIQELRAPRS